MIGVWTHGEARRATACPTERGKIPAGVLSIPERPSGCSHGGLVGWGWFDPTQTDPFLPRDCNGASR